MLVLLQGCNTLYNSKTINIEVLIPGTAKINPEYRKVAVKYNNTNIAWNPAFAKHFEDTTTVIDRSNSDSVASKIYFDVFTRYLNEIQYFDTVTVLPETDFSNVAISDSLVTELFATPNAVLNISRNQQEVIKLARLKRNFQESGTGKNIVLLIDPDFGLYTKKRIETIARQTGADMFVSLDFFAALDGIYSRSMYRYMSDSLQTDLSYLAQFNEAKEIVMILASWSFYDLKKLEFSNHFQKIDTIKWVEPSYSLREAKRMLPPRKDALYNAADLAATELIDFLVPHWINVDRMYYKSGHTELKKTNYLIQQNRWLEAAEIWKKNINNKNKMIAAKSMFNLGLACEMNGDINAAIDWITKSFLFIGNQNEIHAFNCNNYIKVLAQRKLDIKKIEKNTGS
jgi:hypothetical protein